MAIVALGGIVRLLAALLLSPHVDEAASLLAARMTTERGVPILPSGTVYLQGATLSYLLVPLVWLGFDDLSSLRLLRFPVVLIGSLSVPLAYRLGLATSGRERVGVLAALLVAIDPLAVQWSGHLRMYGLLQPLTLALALFLVLALQKPAKRQLLVGIVAVVWLTVFTHAGAALLLAPVAITTAALYRQFPTSERRDWLAMLGLASLAPIVLLLLNRMLGRASVSGGSGGKSPVGFVGDHLLGMRWLSAFRSGTLADLDPSHWFPSLSTFAWLLPNVLVGIVSVVAARRWWRRELPARGCQGVPVLLACYWLPVAAVWIFAVEPRARYHVHALLVGYVLVAVVAGQAPRTDRDRPAVRWSLLPAATALLLATCLGWRLTHPVIHPDYHAAMAYVASERAAHHPVIAALPPAAYLELGGDVPIHFLAGPADRPRAERLTRQGSDGAITDYWIGVPAITSATELQAFISEHPNTWLVVDEERLRAAWAYAGPIAEVIRRDTVVVHSGPGGSLVLRPRATALATTGEAPPG